ncbi:hypothetical protein AS156_16015 [Bradyrhizobium macuxiense]|uniref:Uncharacterized protein n=1 Tax=Bradyrhizobium macuxiense TaxID=1755647 RepID=A0A120FJQ6_9BRAD|nr:hypothetical protein AS156_16015 [Bradyrhizobium macuxiense]
MSNFRHRVEATKKTARQIALLNQALGVGTRLEEVVLSETAQEMTAMSYEMIAFRFAPFVGFKREIFCRRYRSQRTISHIDARAGPRFAPDPLRDAFVDRFVSRYVPLFFS